MEFYIQWRVIRDSLCKGGQLTDVCKATISSKYSWTFKDRTHKMEEKWKNGWECQSQEFNRGYWFKVVTVFIFFAKFVTGPTF